MWPWLKKFFTDETAFVGLARAACIGVGTAVATGQMPVPEDWKLGGIALAAFGGFIRAGEKNTPK